MAGNPWHDERGRFTSQNSAIESYDNAVLAAEEIGDTEEIERLSAERDNMIANNDPESERGQKILAKQYGATGSVKKKASPLGSASVSGETRNNLRALFMSASDLDDTGLDVRERHGANILRGLVDNDDKHLQRAAKELNDDYNQESRERFGDSDGDIKSFNSRVRQRQKAMQNEPLRVPDDIKKRTNSLLEAADYLGDYGKDAVSDDANYIADSLLSGDEDGARTDLDNLETRLRDEEKYHNFLKGSDKKRFDSLLEGAEAKQKWNAGDNGESFSEKVTDKMQDDGFKKAGGRSSGTPVDNKDSFVQKYSRSEDGISSSIEVERKGEDKAGTPFTVRRKDYSRIHRKSLTHVISGNIESGEDVGKAIDKALKLNPSFGRSSAGYLR